MCRLFGLIANKEVDLRFSLTEGPCTFRNLGKLNPDGWGMGWYEKSKPIVFKEPIPAIKSTELPICAHDAQSHIFICHVRKTTGTSICHENCHPFTDTKWIFAHNGSVNRDTIYKKLDDHHRKLILGTTDSEVYFHWVLQNIKQQDDVIKGIHSALVEIRKHHHTGMNFILSDGTTLYAYREAAQNVNYYSLFYLDRSSPGNSPLYASSSEVGSLLESKQLNNEKAILICSEKLTDEDWNDIPLEHLLVLNNNLSITVLEMN